MAHLPSSGPIARRQTGVLPNALWGHPRVKPAGRAPPLPLAGEGWGEGYFTYCSIGSFLASITSLVSTRVGT